MFSRLLSAAAVVLMVTAATADDGLRTRIEDRNGARTDVWVYNDIGKAMQQAQKENKPLFVTFRCVPCHACAAFDADVANGNEKVRELAQEKFIAVRQVEMKGVDLSLFQFDHDLNWAAMFVNSDGVVYARYGTQSVEGPDAYNSIDGLLTTMQRVLELHADYPNNADELKGKRGKPRTASALELKGLQNLGKLAQQTSRQNCIHCHMIHDAEHEAAYAAGRFHEDLLWRYPLPDQIGLKIDRTSGRTIREVGKGSAAASAGLRRGEDIIRMNGQAITSIADMQWVLHNLPNRNTAVEVEGSRSGKKTVVLKAGWKRYDMSWRGSMWSVRPKLRVWAPVLSVDRRNAIGIPKTDTALLVKWINRGSKGGRSAFESGLREGDVIVALNGRPLRDMTPGQFNAHIKLNYKVGQELPVTVLRKGRRQSVRIRLVE